MPKRRISRRSLPPVLLAASICLPALPAAAVAAKQNQDKTCGNTRIDVSWADTLYSALNNNGEGKLGPRRLVVNQSGRVVSKGTRLFVAGAPMDIDQATIRVKKTDGKAKTSVAICATATGPDARQTVLKTWEIPNGNANVGTTWTRDLSGIKGKRLSVYFKGKSVANTLAYYMTVERPNTGDVFVPTQTQLNTTYRPVEGFADLHAHHAAYWAFGKGWSLGPLNTELPPDPLSHSQRLTVNFAGLTLQELRPAHTGQTVPAWNDTSHQQMNLNALKGAHDNGLGLVVSTVVNSEWLCSVLVYARQTDKTVPCGDMESAKLQVQKIKQLDEQTNWFQVVTNPWQARSAMYDGQLAVVLGIEVSNLFPTSDGDWRRQLDELYAMGVRSYFIVHETNNRFAGAAYHHTEDLKLPNQLTATFSRDIKYASNGTGTKNAIGLTSTGRDLVRELMKRHALIDLDHISWKGVDAVFKIAKGKKYYPLFASHTRVNGLLTAEHEALIPELNAPPRIRDYIKQTGGMVGLRPGPERSRRYDQSGVPNDCGGSVKSLIQHYRFVTDEGTPAAFGSDFNGFVTTLGPRFGPDACPDAPDGERNSQKAAQVQPSSRGAPPSWGRYLDRGMSDIGTEPAVIFDMKALGVNTTNIESSAEAFVKMWTRAYNPNRGRVCTQQSIAACLGPARPLP